MSNSSIEWHLAQFWWILKCFSWQANTATECAPWPTVQRQQQKQQQQNSANASAATRAPLLPSNIILPLKPILRPAQGIRVELTLAWNDSVAICISSLEKLLSLWSLVFLSWPGSVGTHTLPNDSFSANLQSYIESESSQTHLPSDEDEALSPFSDLRQQMKV